MMYLPSVRVMDHYTDPGTWTGLSGSGASCFSRLQEAAQEVLLLGPPLQVLTRLPWQKWERLRLAKSPVLNLPQ